MSNPIIKVNNLSKRYRIGAAEKGYKTFREAIVEGISAPVRNFARLQSLTKFKEGREEDVIWALNGVSFEVNEGEVLGIIGRNGAGKTTLLKILSRITEPTSGFAEIHGRVSSLLEVGTGFHPELTGRENIFLNGAILGMRKKEIERKFDEVVDFSGVEKFIDTPLKRYSSGMQVRLAFSVAAHLEPEIFLVDEVLAVGDTEFQKKCLGKMGEVAEGGRTVLFVSHNMSAIRNLCPATILLEEGKIALQGDTDQVVDRYLSSSKTSVLSQQMDGPIDLTFAKDPSKAMQMRRVRILDHTGTPTADIDNRYPFTTEIEFEVLEPRVGADLYWILYRSDDSIVCGSQALDAGLDRTIANEPGYYVARLTFPGNLLNAGLYRLGLGVASPRGPAYYDRHDISFPVINMQSFGEVLGGQRKGVLLMPLPWQIEMRQPGEGRS